MWEIDVRMPINHFNRQRGFALFEVFLAVIVLAILMAGGYAILGSYRDARLVQTVERDIMNISQTYSPMLNQTMVSDSSTSSIIGDKGIMLTDFLRSVPISAQRLDTPDKPYSYLLSNLTINGTVSKVAFAQSNITSDPATNYFIAGFKATNSQVNQIIQDLNTSMGVFVGTSEQSFKDVGDAAKALKTCVQNNCVYNVYLVSPVVSNSTNFTQDLKAPDLG